MRNIYFLLGIALLFSFYLISSALADTCVTPYDDYLINVHGAFVNICPGTYEIPDDGDPGIIRIFADNVTLDCHNALFIGNGTEIEGKTGIYVVHGNNVTVKNCQAENYRYGIEYHSGVGGFLINNTMNFNFYGISVGSPSGVWIINNTANYNNDGLYFWESQYNYAEGNVFCGNARADIYQSSGLENTGDENTCNLIYPLGGWNDTGTTGCTYECNTSAMCQVVYDDLYINESTKICPRLYNVPDTAGDGIIFIDADDIVVDCGKTYRATINGTHPMWGYGFVNLGHDNVTLKNCNVENYGIGVLSNGGSEINIENFDLDRTFFGIQLNGSDYSRVTDTFFTNTWLGIYLLWANGNVIHDNTFWNNGAGVYLNYSDDNLVDYNFIHYNTNGIWMLNSYNNTVNDTSEIGNDNYGIYMFNSSSNKILDNLVRDNKYGVYLTTTSYSNIINDTDIKENHYGLVIEKDSRLNYVSYNKISDNNMSGIIINQSDHTTLYKNSVYENRQNGIINAFSNLTEIEDNYVSNNELSGIMIENSIQVAVKGCTINLNNYGIILSESEECNLDENTVGANDNDGIYLEYESVSNTIQNSDIYGNLGNGIYGSHTYSTTIRSNEINGNGKDGIRMEGTHVHDRIIGNRIVFNGDYGIVISENEWGQIINNEIEYNDAGIWLTNTDQMTVEDNTINQNTAGNGLWIYYSDNNDFENNTVTYSNKGVIFGYSMENDFNLNKVCYNTAVDVDVIGGSGNSGDHNRCELSSGWDDNGTTGCSYRCVSCLDGIKNGYEEGVDCGGPYCAPCNTVCTTGAKYAPNDTICTEKWPTDQGPKIKINSNLHSCNIFEICDPSLDPIVEDAIICCESEDYDEYQARFSDPRKDGKIGACNNSRRWAYQGNFEDNYNPENMKKCTAYYTIEAFGSNAVYMQGYFYSETCCHGSKWCPDDCSKWTNEPYLWWMGAPSGCGSGMPRPDFTVGGQTCEYYWTWIFKTIKWGKGGYYKSDTDWTQNMESLNEVPTHASIYKYSTGTCADYSLAVTTILRKLGFTKDEILSVDGDEHVYNLIKLPGEPKWHYVDTTGNTGGGMYGGIFRSPDWHCCRGNVRCEDITDETFCNAAGCIWSGSSCTGTTTIHESCRIYNGNEPDCNANSGCEWKVCTYGYCRKLDDGCSNDVYSESRSRCPPNDNIYGCEGIPQ